MFKFSCKALNHVRYAAKPSMAHNIYFLPIRLFSTSITSPKYSTNQQSFTVNYLINSFGFTPELALSTSKVVEFETPDKPDSVLAFFKKRGFTETQISNIFRKQPRVMVCDPEKALLPKLEFLESKGMSGKDVARVVSSSPFVLRRSLEKVIIPSFNSCSDLLQSEEKTVAAIKRSPRLLLFQNETNVTPNIGILREAGVPVGKIMILLMKQPRSFMMSSEGFRQIVEDVEKMGFDPSRMRFLIAVHALRAMKKPTWEKKIGVYKKWGWTEDEILVAFKKDPHCMMLSEDKINVSMDFFVNKIGWPSSFVARRPILLLLSLEKRIVPRFAVYQALLSKGLLKPENISLVTLLLFPEMKFLDKVLSYDEEEGPELLKLYKRNMDLSK